MVNNEITPRKGAIVHEINGLKYFKLQSPYPGDYTKNCGLLGNEIDENFFFLRSNDIENISYDENGHLTLTRVDGETLSVDIDGRYRFKFNKKSGSLTVTHPGGEEEIIDGFLSSGYVRIATNETLKGDGTTSNPLGISEVERTGTYAPAQEFVDLTLYVYYVKKELDKKEFYYEEIEKELIPEDSHIVEVLEKPELGVDKNSPDYIKVSKHGHNLPDATDKGKGYRVVTKEGIDTFGLLYEYDGVKAIDEALSEKKSAWRVPTREDWAALLNAAEYCDEYRTHNTECVNEWTGKDAGARAKSIDLWKKSKDEEHGLPVTGEDNLPISGGMGTFHVLPVGYGEGSRGARDKDFDIEAVKKLSSFWTSTEVDCSKNNPNVYTRTFSYDTRTVLQESSKPSSRLSLRLVRDYADSTMNVHPIENILGYNVPVVLISNPETDYSKVWTSINIGFLEPQYRGVSSNKWDKVSDDERGYRELYFINEWDGSKWIKKEMSEGDSVVLIDGGLDENGELIYNHEWRVYRIDDKHVELIDTAVAMKKEFQQVLDGIQSEIDRIEENTGLEEDGTFKPTESNTFTSDSKTIKDAIDTLDENLNRVDEKVKKFQIQEVSELKSDTARTAYALTLGDSSAIGDIIQIPNDKVIKHIYTGYTVGFEIYTETGEVKERGDKNSDEAIYFVFLDEYGKYSLSEPFNIEDLLQEDEFKDGLEVVEHEVKVKIDEKSDKNLDGKHYIEVSLDGVKLTGISEDFESTRAVIGVDDEEFKNGFVDFQSRTYAEIEESDYTQEEWIEILKKVKDREKIDDEELHKLFVDGQDDEETVPEYIRDAEGKYYHLIPRTNFITNTFNATSAIYELDGSLKKEEETRIEKDNELDEKIDSETERAKSEEARIEKKLDDEIERSTKKDERLDEQDIADDDYVMTTKGLELKRKGGEVITIKFDGDFGEI